MASITTAWHRFGYRFDDTSTAGDIYDGRIEVINQGNVEAYFQGIPEAAEGYFVHGPKNTIFGIYSLGEYLVVRGVVGASEDLGDVVGTLYASEEKRKEVLKEVQRQIDAALDDPKTGGALAFEVTVTILAPEQAIGKSKYFKVTVNAIGENGKAIASNAGRTFEKLAKNASTRTGAAGIRPKRNVSGTVRGQVSGVSKKGVTGTASKSAENVVAPTKVPDTPYLTRVDPAFPGRPDPRFSIDTKTFTAGEITSKGGIRNTKEFWQQWQDLRPESLSKSNRYLIENYDKLKVSPRIDDEWIKVFPEHAPFKGDVIIHHHVDFGQYAIPVPGKTHVGSGGIWHTK
ncbi:hypothetical protein Pan97_07290 [Bremerella volcania]|uniref:Tox-HNH-HHH domain-containing protein n=1 Tax=Bremerella volcania TaxID=2527984 RepID=A0A518C3C6_9BACT|nr:hypothetical protein [Bremerella volcania]QDU73730.1 hypothetical protein Pan97_07290 [Bremerella volcania]